MEYCFTGEGSDAIPAPTSLRGLDAGIYYRTGSLLNAGHAAVRTLVVDSLRHWAREYDVDGFCFVNAENMVQGEPRCSQCWRLTFSVAQAQLRFQSKYSLQILMCFPTSFLRCQAWPECLSA